MYSRRFLKLHEVGEVSSLSPSGGKGHGPRSGCREGSAGGIFRANVMVTCLLTEQIKEARKFIFLTLGLSSQLQASQSHTHDKHTGKCLAQ